MELECVSGRVNAHVLRIFLNCSFISQWDSKVVEPVTFICILQPAIDVKDHELGRVPAVTYASLHLRDEGNENCRGNGRVLCKNWLSHFEANLQIARFNPRQQLTEHVLSLGNISVQKKTFNHRSIHRMIFKYIIFNPQLSIPLDLGSVTKF